jgi:hypothetical protein
MNVDGAGAAQTQRHAIAALVVIVRRMERLVQVADEMEQIFEREQALGI